MLGRRCLCIFCAIPVSLSPVYLCSCQMADLAWCGASGPIPGQTGGCIGARLSAAVQFVMRRRSICKRSTKSTVVIVIVIVIDCIPSDSRGKTGWNQLISWQCEHVGLYIKCMLFHLLHIISTYFANDRVDHTGQPTCTCVT